MAQFDYGRFNLLGERSLTRIRKDSVKNRMMNLELRRWQDLREDDMSEMTCERKITGNEGCLARP